MVEIAGKDAFIFDSMHDEYESEPYHLLNAYYSHTFNKVKLGILLKIFLMSHMLTRIYFWIRTSSFP